MSERAARVLRGLALGDAPAPWRSLGFTVTDDRVHLGGVTLHLTGTGGGILGWQLDPSVDAPVDGLPPASVTGGPGPAAGAPPVDPGPGRAAPTDGAQVHPNGATGVDHVVVATSDHERTATALAGVGLHPRRTVDGARGDVATRYRFTLLGTCLLEVIGPVDPDPGPARPARFVGLALVAPDLTAFAQVAGEPRPAVQPGRHITTVRTRELGIGVPLAVLTPRPVGR